MTAHFLKNDEGNFDYPALAISLFIAFVIFGMGIGIFRAFKTNRILFAWGSTFGGSGQFYIERDKNSLGFWSVFVMYCFCILMFIGLIVSFCFGLLRK